VEQFSLGTWTALLTLPVSGPTGQWQVAFENNDVEYVRTPILVTSSSTPEINVLERSRNFTSIADDGSNAVDFGTVSLGKPGPTRTFTVRNVGNSTLTLGAVSLPTGFTLVEGLSSSLAPGASDLFTVRLDTNTLGTKSGQLSFNTNDPDENSFNFPITGVVVGAGVSIAQSAGSTDVTEGGATDAYTLVLTTQPSANVTITVSANSQITVSPTSLTFTSSNWNSTQTVTVTAVNDRVAEGNHTGTISHTAASSDSKYNGISIASLAVNITDNDSPGVTIAQSGSSTDVTEGGATDTYTVVLTTQPTANVTITVSPSTQVSVSSTSLTFTSSNWNTAQTVTVTALNDSVVEGNHTGTISHTAASSDFNYNGISIASVTADITDNDAAGVSIVQTGGSTDVTEGGATDTYTVVLTTQPTANVAITFSPSSQVTVSSTSLTFTSSNWNAAQSVTVTAVDDDLVEGNHTGTINHTAASGDPKYNALVIAAITANIIDRGQDTTPPAAPSMPDLDAGSDSGSSNSDNITYVSTPHFVGTAESGSTVRIYVDGVERGSGIADAGNGAYSIQVSTLPEGRRSITGTATDVAGNISDASTAIFMTIDTTAPSLDWIEPIAGRRRAITELHLHFSSDDLECQSAQNLDNYVSTRRTGRRLKNVPLRSASCAGSLVTLAPVKPLSVKNLSRYTLTVRNTRDVAGNGMPDFTGGIPPFPFVP
jgi:hypothetical protein